MAGETTPSLFVTANVGSIFEDPTSMLKTWTEEFLATVVRLDPKFVALHCQEVGGKKYEASMKHVEDFVKLLLSSEELRLFDRAEIYLDEDFSSTESFTALGNFYLIHESVREALVFDFENECFVPVVGKNIHSGNIEDVPTKEKSKFPQDLFPECKWARKGFMRTRWKLNGTVFDLINIHLFHDASNFVAMESFPSIYCQNRQRALEHTLKRFHTDRYGGAPYILFGDFNFRTDTQGVVKKLSEGLNAVRVHSNKSTEHTKLQYTDDSSQVIFTLGKKEFSHMDHQKMFTENVSEWLKELDREYEPFREELHEFAIAFPPTYPYVEDNNGGECYMQTRCPSWCDRVFLSCTAKSLVNNIHEESSVEYGLIGRNSCMGDHKPVYLRAELIGGQGTVSYAPLVVTSDLPIATPCLYAINSLPPSPPPSPPLARSSTTPVPQDGLTVPPFQHHNSPYTPDSTDTEPDSLPASAESRVSPQELASSLELAAERKRSTASVSMRKNWSMRRSSSKIPVREVNHPTTTILVTPPSRIPVSKTKRKSDANGAKRSPAKNEEVILPRLVLNVEPPCSDEECGDSESAGESPVGEISFINSLAPTRIPGSESDSVTDSGFSVSPALSGGMSPVADSSEKSSTAINPKIEDDDPIEITPTVAFEKFSLVRRIQSASSMERKKSFPPALPEDGSPDEENGMRTYRCFSDSTWRERPPARPAARPPVLTHTQSRIRLISSSSNLEQPLPRLQSHHSSSEEEWFEQVSEENKEEARNKLGRQKTLSNHEENDSCDGKDALLDEAVPMDKKLDRVSVASYEKTSRKKSKCKACCIVM